MHCVLIGKMGAVHLKPSGSKEFVVYSSQVLVCLEWVRHNAGHPLSSNDLNQLSNSDTAVPMGHAAS